MGSVYRARDERSGKLVAIKQLSLTGTDEDARFRGWFQRELKALTLLDHEGVLRLIDHGEDNGTPFVVTELLEGADLGVIVESRGPLPEPEGLRIAERALAALAAAHALGIAHRDIKPSNIFLCTSGRVVVLDFGLARGLSSEQSKTMAQGFGTNVMGTPHYLSPEQLAGVQLSLSADLFSFASTFYFLLSGQHAFAGATVLEVVRAIAKNQREPLGVIMPSLAQGTCSFVEKLMMPAPADRPADAVAARKLLAPLVAKRGASDAALQAFAQYDDLVRPELTGVTGVTGVTAAGVVTEHTSILSPAPMSQRMLGGTATAPHKQRTLRWAAMVAGAITVLGLGAVWVLRPPPEVTVETAGSAEIYPPLPIPASLPTPAGLPVPVAERVPGSVPTEEIPAPSPMPVAVKPPPAAVPARVPPMAAKSAAKGTLNLVLAQWAEVTIDDKPFGRKRFATSFELAVGTHEILFTNAKYGTQLVRVTIHRDQTTTIEHDFVAHPPAP